MHEKTIGVLGGFGGYATLNFYKRFLEEFKGETERSYPHIIFDNNFTMPSRTKALLTGEDYSEIVDEISNSIDFLLHGGSRADIIILACGTAHCFLPDVYKKLPDARAHVLDIIDTTGKNIKDRGIETVFVMAAEGALSSRLYEKRFEKYGITCKSPDVSDYKEIRYYIECVKQNAYDAETKNRFLTFVNKYEARNVLLGCTELPVLISWIEEGDKTKDEMDIWGQFTFLDPLEFTLLELKQLM